MIAEEQKEEGARQGQICGLARETDGPWPAPLPCGDALVVGQLATYCLLVQAHMNCRQTSIYAAITNFRAETL